MPAVKLRDGETVEGAMRRLRRSVERSSILRIAKSQAFFEKPTTKRKRKKAAAVKRWQKKIMREQQMLEQRRDRR